MLCCEEILAYDDVEAAVAMSSAVLVLLSPGLDATLIAKSHSLQCHTLLDMDMELIMI